MKIILSDIEVMQESLCLIMKIKDCVKFLTKLKTKPGSKTQPKAIVLFPDTQMSQHMLLNSTEHQRYCNRRYNVLTKETLEWAGSLRPPKADLLSYRSTDPYTRRAELVCT